MSIWEKLSVEEKVREALGTVTIVNESGHHFGRPYMTAYQLAIKVDRMHPEVARELKAEVGGSGKGYSLYPIYQRTNLHAYAKDVCGRPQTSFA